MDNGWSVSSETVKEPDKDSIGFQIKALLDGEKLNFSKLPAELRFEHEEWEKEFPNLCIFGKKIPIQSNAANEKQQLRMTVASQLVKIHLWPEMRRILDNNSSSTTKEQRTRRPCNLPKINP